MSAKYLNFSFFFQAEDGIRDFHVTGVQTCALPIMRRHLNGNRSHRTFTAIQRLSYIICLCAYYACINHRSRNRSTLIRSLIPLQVLSRSEERRVGIECISRYWQYYVRVKKVDVTGY